MKRKFLVLLPVFALSLTGCEMRHQAAIGKINVIQPKTARDNNFFDIGYDHFINMVESKNSFLVLFHTEGCHLCSGAKKILNSYINEKSSLVYAVEVDVLVQSKLNERFPGIIESYPNMVVFDKGELTYQFDQNNLIIDNAFRTELNKLQYSSNMYYGIDKDTIDSFISDKKDLLLVAYNSSIKESYKFVFDYVKSQAEKSSKITLFVDNFFTNTEYLNGKLNIIFTYKNGAVEKIAEINYDDSDFTNSVNIVTSYY